MRAMLLRVSLGKHLLLQQQPCRRGLLALHVSTAAPGRTDFSACNIHTATAPKGRRLGSTCTHAVPAPAPLRSAEDVFYAESSEGFADLGITPALVDALRAAGFTKPSRVQELVLPEILSGKDVVLAAETGSGKTLAYIAPIASQLLKRQQAAAASAAALAVDAAAAADGELGVQQPKVRRQMALVLCPNAALCQQVVRLVNSLQAPISSSSSSHGKHQPLLRACQVSSSNPPPFDPPDIVVTTPGALVTLFNDRGFSYGGQWTAEGVSNRAAFVVVDEADLLSQGGYVKDLTRLLDALKAGERRLIEAQVMSELDISDDEFSRLPRNIKQACWEAGAPGMIKAGFRISKQRKQQQQQQGETADDSSDSSQQASSSSGAGAAYGPYFKRQYLFVAATLPALTKADVGTELQRRFKSAVWVSGDMLHQVKPHVQHTWVCVAADTADEKLIHSIREDLDYQAGQARVLVFTRDTASADRVSAVLQEAGISNVLYHKNVPREQREAALAAMAAGAADNGGSSSSAGNAVMVSTDAASRGIDLPDITHVVQADFAVTAIEFLHRVGRTARAGKEGKVTSLFTSTDAVLVGALRKYIQEGLPIEDCFSRNRSFSKKVKRYGKFVPRGQQG